jgi:hypothetical protein
VTDFDIATSILEAAIRYAKAGVKVFPCNPATKRPFIPTAHPDGEPCRGECGRHGHGFYDATVDLKTVEGWFGKKYRGALIATPTGSGLLTLDIDPRSGGQESLGKLQEQHGPLPRTRTARTGGGGTHFDFKIDRVVRNSASKLAPGVDVRADGGYRVLPPSVSAAGPYAWIDEIEPAPIPEWLLGLIEAAAQAEAASSFALPEKVHKKERNETLFRQASAMRRTGMDAEELVAVLETVNSRRCVPPLPKKELMKIAKSAAKYKPAEQAKPKEPPPAPLNAPAEFAPPDPANLSKLILSIEEFIDSYAVLLAAQILVEALWVVHAATLDAFDVTPYLNIYSPVLECGKTLNLEVLELILPNPWLTGRATAAVLMRKIDKRHPTLLLDESDAAFGGDKEYAEALRGLLNTGYKRTGSHSACVGQGANIDFKDFSTFCPKAIAGIGDKLPLTVRSRSIPISMRRKKPSETREKFRRRDAIIRARPIVNALSAWGSNRAVLDILRRARPAIPAGLDNRTEEIAEPLLAVAELAGEDIAKRARIAILSLCSAQRKDLDLKVRLLQDIRSICDEGLDDRITSEDLIKKLVADTSSRWADWKGNGKNGFSPNALARLLRPFEIEPRNIRRPGEEGIRRGYQFSWFEAAWEEYLPSSALSMGLQTATTATTPVNIGRNAPSQSATSGACGGACSGCGRATLTNKQGLCSGCSGLEAIGSATEPAEEAPEPSEGSSEPPEAPGPLPGGGPLQ